MRRTITRLWLRNINVHEMPLIRGAEEERMDVERCPKMPADNKVDG